VREVEKATRVSISCRRRTRSPSGESKRRPVA
jgi:hypothetical protein